MRNFPQKIENFTFLPEIACNLARHEIFPKNVLKKFSQKLKIFYDQKTNLTFLCYLDHQEQCIHLLQSYQ